MDGVAAAPCGRRAMSPGRPSRACTAASASPSSLQPDPVAAARRAQHGRPLGRPSRGRSGASSSPAGLEVVYVDAAEVPLHFRHGALFLRVRGVRSCLWRSCSQVTLSFWSADGRCPKSLPRRVSCCHAHHIHLWMFRFPRISL